MDKMRHLIEPYHVLQKSIPKKMVKCADRGVLRNIRKTDSMKFDMLVSIGEKSIDTGVQVNLQPVSAIFSCIDKEEFQKMKEKHRKLENRLAELEEMIRRGDEKHNSRNLKMARPAHTQTESELSLSSVYDLTEKVDKLSTYQESLAEKMNGELTTIESDVETIKYCYGVLNKIFQELDNKLILLERNTEKPMRKYDAIKTRVAALERDVMKNTSHIIGMDHSNRSMEWTRLQYSRSAGMFSPDNRCYGEPAPISAAPSYYDMPLVSGQPTQYFLPPMTPFGPSAPPPPAPPAPSAFLPSPPPAPPVPSAIFQPPPPAPPKPSAFLPKPPPIILKRPGLVTGSDKSSSSSVVTPKAEKVYHQIPITTEMLKSVVLKPPDETKRVNKSTTNNRGVVEKKYP